MGWTKGIKCTGGLFAGQTFPGNGDLPDTYEVAPHFTPVGTLNYYRGEGGAFEGFNILTLFNNMNEGDRQLLYIIDIKPAPSSAFVKSELRGFVEKNGAGLTYFIVVREYTDDTTYTDRDIRESSVTIGSFFPAGSSQYVETKYIYVHFVYTSYNGVSAVCTGLTWRDDDWLGNITYREAGYMQDYPNFISIITGTVPEEEFSPEFGPAAEPEGYDGGSFDDHSDVVDFPSDPQSILGLGFINVYKCSANSLVQLGAELFPEITWPSSLSDVGEVIAALSDSIWNSRLIDYVISVHCVPGDVTAGSPEDIKIGARTMLGIRGSKITSEYVTFDFGSVQTDRVFKNYADIMTGCRIFLPFYGFVSLPAEYWNGCTLTLKYKFNVIDGSFLAYLKASECYYSELNGVIGQYGGSAVVHMPTTGANYAAMFSSVIGSTGALAGSIASGNVGGVASSMTSIAANIGSGGDAQRAGSYNASSSFMSMRQPFLLIELPVPQFPTKYAPEKGLPANITYVLGTLQGLVICDSPRITFACTEDEQKEIIAALQEGIII